MAEHYHIVLQQWNQIRDRTNSTEVEPLEFNTQMTLPELVQTVFEKVTWRKVFLLWMAWCWHHISWFLWKLVICFELEESVSTEVLQQGLQRKVVQVGFVFELQIYGDFFCCIMLNDWCNRSLVIYFKVDNVGLEDLLYNCYVRRFLIMPSCFYFYLFFVGMELCFRIF